MMLFYKCKIYIVLYSIQTQAHSYKSQYMTSWQKKIIYFTQEVFIFPHNLQIDK